MALTNAGRNHIARAIINNTGESPDLVHFDQTNTRIGVGDSSTAFSASQTDLQAATNKHREALDSAPDLTSANVIRFVSTFESADANFDWNEWGIFNAASGGTMLLRKVSALGTKTSAAAWTLTVDITVNAA